MVLWVGGAIALNIAAKQLHRRKRESIAIVGDCYVDILAVGLDSLPSWGSDLRAPQIAMAPGGSGMNTATHLSALLANTTLAHPVHCDLRASQPPILNQPLRFRTLADRERAAHRALVFVREPHSSHTACSGARRQCGGARWLYSWL